MSTFIKQNLLNLFLITVGTCLYAFGFVQFNMANHLAQGGIAGISLIVHAKLHINPAFTQYAINIPLLLVGYRYLERRTFFYTLYGATCVSFFIWFVQLFNFTININHDDLIAALLAGVCAGAGVGLVFRTGGTTGGSDIIAKLLQDKKGIPIGRTFFMFDSVVLALSLSYINLTHMMYTLIASFVSSQVVGIVQSGGYTVRGMIIISDKYEEIAQAIVAEFGRGATYLQGEGAYSGHEKRVIYVVLNPREIQEMKHILAEIDPKAFASIINVHEVIGDFIYPKSRFVETKK